jgi:hypothetical protein
MPADDALPPLPQAGGGGRLPPPRNNNVSRVPSAREKLLPPVYGEAGDGRMAALEQLLVLAPELAARLRAVERKATEAAATAAVALDRSQQDGASLETQLSAMAAALRASQVHPRPPSPLRLSLWFVDMKNGGRSIQRKTDRHQTPKHPGSTLVQP